MGFKYARFVKLYESMYTDRLRVYRHVEVINDDGTTGISPEPVPIAGVSCRISFNSKDSSAMLREEINPQNLQLQVFCRPEVDVIKGDMVEVDRIGDDGSVLKS